MTDPPDRHFFARAPGAPLLKAVRGEGIYLFDAQGRPFIDGASGAAVACLGHGHRRVIDAMTRQASAVAFTHSSVWITDAALELSDRLAAWMPGAAARVYFASGGSEAVDTAIKIARAYHLAKARPGRFRMVARDVAYHGATFGAMAVTGMQRRRAPYLPMLAPPVRTSTAYCYRCPHGLQPSACAQACAGDVVAAIDASSSELMAFIAEPVIGASAPGIEAPEGYFQRIAEVCRRHDILFIADEVMSGAGRTGRPLAMAHYGVWPDMAVVSKGVSGGYAPLGAVIVSEHVYDTIRSTPPGAVAHGFTYSANPLAAAVGCEVQRVIDEEQLLPHVEAMGTRLVDALRPLVGRSIVGDVRGRGLLVGVEFVHDQDTRAPFPPGARVAQRVFDACVAEGLIVYPCAGTLPAGNGDQILLAPPYITRPDQIDDLAARFARAVAAVSASAPWKA